MVRRLTGGNVERMAAVDDVIFKISMAILFFWGGGNVFWLKGSRGLSRWERERERENEMFENIYTNV